MKIINLHSRGQVITNEEADLMTPRYNLALGAKPVGDDERRRVKEVFLHIKTSSGGLSSPSLVEINCLNQSHYCCD